MKRIFLICSLLISVIGFGQSVVPRSSPANTPDDPNHMSSRMSIIPRFYDTTEANTKWPTLDSAGKIIYTRSDKSFWYRQDYPKKWVQVLTNDTSSRNQYIINIIDSLINNSVSNVQILNDSTVRICDASGACVNIGITTTVTNINYVSFYNDSTLIVCRVDTIASVCDTISITPQTSNYLFANGIRQFNNKQVEFGDNSDDGNDGLNGAGQLRHNTTLDARYNKLNFYSAKVYDYGFQINKYPYFGFESGTGLMSWLHENNAYNRNTVRLGMNFTDSIYQAGLSNLPGFFGSHSSGYFFGTNITGYGTALNTDDSNAKIAGIFFDVKGTDSSAVFIYGKHQPNAYPQANILLGQTMANYRIATFNTNKTVQFNGYNSTNNIVTDTGRYKPAVFDSTDGTIKKAYWFGSGSTSSGVDSFYYKIQNEVVYYNKGTFSDDFFHPTDTSLTFTNNLINFNSTTDKNLALVLKNGTDTFYHNSERWEIRATMELDTLTQGSDGFVLAAKSIAPGSGNYGLHVIGHGGGANYVLAYLQANGANLVLMPTYIQFNRGDVFTFSVKRDRNYIIASIAKVGSAPIEWRMQIGNELASSYHLPVQLQDFRMECRQGQYIVQNLQILTSDGFPDLAFMGNSITAMVAATTYDNGFAEKSRMSIPNSTIIAGPGMETSDGIKEIRSIILTKPKTVAILLGTNDFSDNIPLATTKANYQKIVDSLVANNIIPIICSILPRNTATSSVAPFNAWLQSTFPQYQYVDFFTGMKRSTSDSLLAIYDSGDGLHPNDAGHQYMANYFVEQYSKYYIADRTRLATFNGGARFNNLQLLNLQTGVDTTNYKPIATDAYGNQFKMTFWPGSYTLPTASTSVLGGVKVDGTTITISSGVISAVGSSGNYVNLSPSSKQSGFAHLDSVKADEKIKVGTSYSVEISKGVVGGATSYANSGGTGNRTSLITVTTDLTFSGSWLTRIIDGDLTTQNAWLNTDPVSGKYIKFDFGAGNHKVITEAKYYQSGSSNQGTFKFQTSDDNVTWTDASSSFALGGASTQTITALSGNTTAARYYRLLGISGNTSNADYSYQMEFKIADAGITPKVQTSISGVASGSVYQLNPNGGSVEIGDSLRLIATPNTYSTGGYDILVRNQTSGYVQKVASSSFLTGITADNGLTASTSTNVQLFGGVGTPATLLSDRYLTAADKTMNITYNSLAGASGLQLSSTSTAAASNVQKVLEVLLSGANSTANEKTYAGYFSNTHTGTNAQNRAIYGETSGASSIAAYFTSTNGTGMVAISDGGTYGAEIQSTTGIGAYIHSDNGGNGLVTQSIGGVPVISNSILTSTNTVSGIYEAIKNTTGTAANGLGGSIDFKIEGDDGGNYLSNQLISKWTIAANATRTSQFIITGVNSAVTADLLTLSGNGNTRLNKYGVGTFSGTTAYNVSVDASGNLIETSNLNLNYYATAVDYTVEANRYVVNVTATGKTITLPTAVGIAGRIITVKLTASGSGTIATTSSQTIDGSTTYSLSAQYKFASVMSDGANWIIIANN